MYLSEIRDLISGIDAAIARLKAAGEEWVEQRAISGRQIAAPPDDFDPSLFNDAIRASAEQQGDSFMMVESLLSQWARLSLLVHPIPGPDPSNDWRLERGRVLRYLLDLPDDTLLSKRDVRDSWMHFDERLDLAYREGWLGNRQQFTDTHGAPAATRHSVRVIDLESGAIHYRTRNGSVASVTIAEIGVALNTLMSGLATVRERLPTIPMRDRDSGA